METKLTQTERVLKYMYDFGSITQLQAFKDLGCMRLTSRIYELKRAGYNIIGETIAVKNRYGEKCHIKKYSLERSKNEN